MANEPEAVASPDMNKYHYRPGTTEPELRPEFAAPAPEPAVAPKKAKAAPKANAAKAAAKPIAKKK